MFVSDSSSGIPTLRRVKIVKTKFFTLWMAVCFCEWMGLLVGGIAFAQLVSDGETRILDGVITNISGDVIVGTNGAFTQLILTNGTTLTNIGNLSIGSNVQATSNAVVIGGPGTQWGTGLVRVGDKGAANELTIRAGGRVRGSLQLGGSTTSSNNIIRVIDNGSFLSVGFSALGNLGWGNKLLIANGGSARFGAFAVGFGGLSSGNNLIILDGIGAQLTNSAEFYLGYTSSSNALLIANGASMVSDSIDSFRTSVVGLSLGSAQNMATVTGAGSLWTNRWRLEFGLSGPANQLVISDNAVVAASGTSIGTNAQSIQNVVTVSGRGIWTNRDDVFVGGRGASNQVVVTNAGVVYTRGVAIGRSASSTNNVVLVTGSNSIWTNYWSTNVHGVVSIPPLVDPFMVGCTGALNQLNIRDAGAVITMGGCCVGFNGSGNQVTVSDSGSLLHSYSDIIVGHLGESNHLAVLDGGSVIASNLIVGLAAASDFNRLKVNSGRLIVTNLSHTGRADIRRGVFSFGSGTFQTDILILTNSGQMKFDGGTMQIRSTSITNGQPFVVGDGTQQAKFELAGNGAHNFANSLIISSSAVLSGNGSINGNVFVGTGGTISPGESLGELVINGSLVLSNGSRVVMELNVAAGTNDIVSGLASVTYGGSLELTNFAGVLTNGTLFKLFGAGNYLGAFTSIVPTSPGPGLKWDASRLNVDGTLKAITATSQPPLFTDFAITGSTLVLTATGFPYDAFILLTHSNVSAPLSAWTRVLTNNFDNFGKASINKDVTSGSRSFYALQLQ
jgi:T5SS/PEP-CTERM-associated repeat protein